MKKYKITRYSLPSTGKIDYIVKERFFLFIWINLRIFDNEDDAVAFYIEMLKKIKN